MGKGRYLYRGLWIAGVLAVCGCGGGGGGGSGTNLSPSEATAVTATLGRYFDALRRNDVAGVRAELAPDYSFDPGDPLSDPTDPFNRPGGVRYRSLSFRVESLTGAGGVATAGVATTFEGNLNLEILLLGLGRPPVTGDGRTVIELEKRGAAWKLTAIRPVRMSYRYPLLPVPTLQDYAVNGRQALQVAPGTPLTLTGKSVAASLVVGVIGSRFQTATLAVDASDPLKELPWELHLQAPDTPGRFLTYALTLVLAPDPDTGAIRFLAGDQVSVLLTVVGP